MKNYSYVTSSGIVQITSSLHDEEAPPLILGLSIVETNDPLLLNLNPVLQYHLDTKQWIDPRTVQDIKDAQWTLIKSSRENAEYTGFTWDTSTFDSDQLSQQRIAGAVQLAMIAQAANQPFSITWTLQDGTFRTLTGQEMMQVGLALGQHVQTQFAKGQVLQKQLADASTKVDIEAVVW